MNLWIIFLTGLTTGGLTCLAVQGGLLATAITKQVQVNQPQPKRRRAKGVRQSATGVQVSESALPVTAFLTAKLIAHTLLGFLLGALGSAVQLTSTVQVVMQLTAGVFMLGTALNMMNVHPIFRYFVIQPPKFLTRMIRNQAKSQDMFAPALLGLMTIFIPCGTTQAMEILAISSSDPLLGAAIMFAFVLGTSPTFFVLGFIATKIRGKFQSAFVTITAILVLILGIVAIDSALSLMGSPLAPRRVIASLIGDVPPVDANMVNGVQEVTIRADNMGYTPPNWNAQSGAPIRVRLLSENNLSCTRVFTIPSLGIRRDLPLTGEVIIDVPAQTAGDLYFTCGMGMYTGVRGMC
jgi:uncharacterized protein